MALAWGLAVPAAVLLARFFKITPRQRWPAELDSKLWWHGHRFLNYGAAALTVAGVAWVFDSNQFQGPIRSIHGTLGWIVVALLAVQIVSAHLRGTKGGPTAPRLTADGLVLDQRGDHYDMTSRRYGFERVHKYVGYAAIALAMTTILTGLWTADAIRWMWAAMIVSWTGIAIVFLYWQRRGRCLDTYQAIWGPGLEHPGNSKRIVGWGVRRVRPPERVRRG